MSIGNWDLDCDYRMDLVVDDSIVVEKAVAEIIPVHKAQLLT